MMFSSTRTPSRLIKIVCVHVIKLREFINLHFAPAQKACIGQKPLFVSKPKLEGI